MSMLFVTVSEAPKWEKVDRQIKLLSVAAKSFTARSSVSRREVARG
jgi:hypothetical protein